MKVSLVRILILLRLGGCNLVRANVTDHFIEMAVLKI